MGDLADLIVRSIEVVGSHVEQDVLGTDDPATVADAIGSACRELGPMAGARFYEAGVGLVAGLVLDDGTEVVVKVHRFNADLERMRACVEVQRALHAAGLPAPRPLAPVRRLANGVVTVEALAPGEPGDGSDPAVRRAMAELLHRFIEAARGLTGQPGLARPYLRRAPDEPLWPAPHDLRFDFAATATGAEWIDALAEEANTVLTDDRLPLAVGHLDWRTQNLGWRGTEVVAVYDWDSVALASEPWIVGVAAGGFCIDWRHRRPDPPPTLAEMRAFVVDYEAVRERPFTSEERCVLDAANLSMIAYGARCQHSDQLLRPDLGDNRTIGWPRLLRERGGPGALL